MSTPRPSAPVPSRAEALQRLRDSYAQSITAHTDALVQRLGAVMKAAHVRPALALALLSLLQISEEPENARERLQIEACSSDIVRSAQALLRIISELKHQVLLNDFAGIEEDATAAEDAYRAQEQELKLKLDSLRKEYARTLAAGRDVGAGDS